MDILIIKEKIPSVNMRRGSAAICRIGLIKKLTKPSAVPAKRSDCAFKTDTSARKQSAR